MKPFVLIKQFIKKLVFEKIAFLLPQYRPDANATIICTLLCHRDIAMFCYMIHSFSYFSRLSLPITIINDGSLTQSDIRFLKRSYHATVITKQRILNLLTKSVFSSYANIKHFVTADYTPVTKWKIAFMLTNPSSRYIFMDSDILFFAPPKAIQSWVSENKSICLHMEYHPRQRTFKYSDDENYLDVYHAYREALKMFRYHQANTLFNNGILCVPDCHWIDPKYLSDILRTVHDTYFDNQFGTDELILSCLFQSRQSHPLLPDRYPIQLDSIRRQRQNIVCVHYCWRAKLLFPRDALTLLITTRGFTKGAS